MLRRSSRAVPTYSELVFNRIKCSESTEVILCMDGDVTTEEDPKPYLDQVYGGRVIQFSTRQDLAAAEQYFPGYTITSEVVSSRTAWIQSRLQSVLFLSESLLCLYYNSVTWMTLCLSLAIT